LKIFSISKVEATSGKSLELKDVPFIAQLDINNDEFITLLSLNYENKILVVLSLKENPANAQFEQYLYAFNLDTLATDNFPKLIKRVQLNTSNDVNTIVTDLRFSPSEKDLFALCTRGGTVKLWRLNESEAKLSKNYNSTCGKCLK
jgi:WD40 repeat protein